MAGGYRRASEQKRRRTLLSSHVLRLAEPRSVRPRLIVVCDSRNTRRIMKLSDLRAESRNGLSLSRGPRHEARLLLALLLTLQPLFKCPAATATGKQGIVATVHPLATRAAIEVMKNGGNAVDAAVA